MVKYTKFEIFDSMSEGEILEKNRPIKKFSEKYEYTESSSLELK
jgi:hypothetical protein